MAPRARPGGAVSCGSPATTSVLVTRMPTLPPWPVFGMFIPRRVGLLRMASGVSPCGTWNFSVPLLRSIAEITPYGGFRIEPGTRPVHAAAGIADVDRAEEFAPARWLQRRRHERRLLPAVLAEIVERLLVQLGREVDDVVLADERPRVRRGFARNR